MLKICDKEIKELDLDTPIFTPPEPESFQQPNEKLLSQLLVINISQQDRIEILERAIVNMSKELKELANELRYWINHNNDDGR